MTQKPAVAATLIETITYWGGIAVLFTGVTVGILAPDFDSDFIVLIGGVFAWYGMGRSHERRRTARSAR